MNLIKIAGYTPAENPTEYVVTLSDIDGESSGRGDTGYMTRDRARGEVANIDVGYTNLSSDEVVRIKNAVSAESLSVEYFFGGTQTATMYASDKKITLKYIDESANAFWDMSFSLVEF